MASYANNPNAKIILDYARRTGADPYTLLATAIKESSLNPKAVGDGGTSYGLFQMHVGGAGGTTHASAQKYLDPRVAAENRARYFRGGSGGAFAASVQRPADRKGYARAVDQIIAQLKSGGGLPTTAGSAGPARTAASVNAPASAPSGDRKAAALAFIMDDGDGDFLAGALKRKQARQAPAPQMSAPRAARAATGAAPSMSAPAKAPPMKKGEAGWQYIQRLGQTMFGLKNDAGTSQLYGGRHSAGSEHGWDKPNPAQAGRAVDFGDAKNSRQALNAWKAWAKRAGFDALDEGNHIHVSMPGGGI